MSDWIMLYGPRFSMTPTRFILNWDARRRAAKLRVIRNKSCSGQDVSKPTRHRSHPELFLAQILWGMP